MQKTPVRKVKSSGIAGIVVGIAVFGAKQFGVDVPDEVASAVIVLVSFLAAYFTRPHEAERAYRVG